MRLVVEASTFATFNPTDDITIAVAIRVHSYYYTGNQLEFPPRGGALVSRNEIDLRLSKLRVTTRLDRRWSLFCAFNRVLIMTSPQTYYSAKIIFKSISQPGSTVTGRISFSEYHVP